MNIRYFEKESILLLYDGTHEEIIGVVAKLENLCNGKLGSALIHEPNGALSNTNAKLVAKVSCINEGVKLISEGSFECSLTISEWEWIRDKVIPFKEPSLVNGHQYLDEHSDIELIISTCMGW